ncbi:DUF6376 family protein [Sutcliffiella horikoshii]|uniref:DUF6376 family protein n=1 Tax=Sutcliffiella horikoshii TaxID=79883 RepID=UPI0007D0B647|nr:DUF6376 family protein [Sutcliffiella horikoshii]MCM3617084.1 DUF6376 family protein [Sutcliffiella horikoshii]
MRKILLVTTLLTSILLSGCSVLEEVNNSLAYVNKATEHINTWQDFGQEAPQMIQEAATDAKAKEDLEAELSTLLNEIDDFNNTEAPAIAEGVHNQIVEKNEALKGIIESSMVNGELALDKLEQSEFFTLINEVTTMMNLLEDLGG